MGFGFDEGSLVAKRCCLVAERNGEALQNTRNIHNTAYIDVLDGN